MLKDLEASSRHRRLAILGVALLILTVLVGLSYRQWKNYPRANAEAERSREIVAAIDNLLATLAEAESGQRGFLLTADSRYLEPYNRAVQGLPEDLATLRRLLIERHRGSQGIDELTVLADKKLDELRQAIETRRTQGAQAAVATVLTDEAKSGMDSIRTLCIQMRTREVGGQARASDHGEAAAGVALLITVAGSLVLLFFFAFGLEPFASPDPQAWRRSWLLRYGGRSWRSFR